MKKIAISLITYNDLSYTKACLLSLLKSDIIQYDIKLFWWDNNSADAVEDFINTLTIDVYKNISSKNDGIVIPRIKLYNKIVEEDFDYLLEIHADMVFPEIWIDSVFSIDEDAAIILMPTIINTNRLITYNEINNLSEKYKRGGVIHCARQVHPWIIKLNMLHYIGGYYDSIYSPMRLEDDDLVWRVLNNGYKIKATRDSIVCHYGSKTRGNVSLKGTPNSVFENKNRITVKNFIKLFDEHPVIRI